MKLCSTLEPILQKIIIISEGKGKGKILYKYNVVSGKIYLQAKGNLEFAKPFSLVIYGKSLLLLEKGGINTVTVRRVS